MKTPLLALTPGDDGPARDLTTWFGPLAEAGLVELVLREPHVSPDRLAVLCEAAAAQGLQVWVHDRHPAARARPEGLHLKADTPPPVGRQFGQSCHDPTELDRAFGAGATYALLSPVFRPTSKPDDRRPALGIDRFVAWAAGRPVYALGGITPDRAGPLRVAGAPGMAVLGAIFDPRDPAQGAKVVTKLLAAWENGT